MELRQLTTFVRVAQFQSFSKAAASLGYSQSAVTVQIRLLEQELGVRLFDRMCKRVILTGQGRQFLESAYTILQDVNRASLALAQDSGALTGQLHIGTLESLCFARLPGVIHTFRTKHPAVNLQITTGIPEELIRKMEQGEVDIIYILDEPIYGLDPQGIAEIRETLSRLNKEKNITFIISSHILEELSKIATNYGIIHDGVLLQEMTREELLAKCSERIELKTDDTRKACTVLEGMGIEDYKVVDASTIQVFERLNDGGDITMALAENGVKTMGITVKNEALEDYYLNLTGGTANV